MFRVIHLSDDNPRTINLLCSSKTESELRMCPSISFYLIHTFMVVVPIFTFSAMSQFTFDEFPRTCIPRQFLVVCWL